LRKDQLSHRWAEILFGIEPSSWADGGRWSLDWLALPGGDRMLGVLAALLGIVLGLFWLYRREAPHVSAGRRALLMGLRLAAIALSACMLFEPIIVLSREEFIPSNVFVLVDASESMSLRDAWRDESAGGRVASAFRIEKGVAGLRELRRADLAQKFLSPDVIKSIAGDGDRIVQVRTFAEALGNAVDPAADDSLPAPHGQTTAAGDSLQQALIAGAGQPVAGILLLTDGQVTAVSRWQRRAMAANEESPCRPWRSAPSTGRAMRRLSTSKPARSRSSAIRTSSPCTCSRAACRTCRRRW
jgi:hypothetical protein